MIHEVRQHDVALVTAILALLAHPVSVARLAREVVECGCGVLVVLQSHALEGLVREEAEYAVAEKGNEGASCHVEG
jgi:hypothetical protein